MNTISTISDEVDRCLKNGAINRIVVGLDEHNNYSTTVDSLIDTPNPDINRNFARQRLVPSGSQWSHLIGWRDFFGIPFSINSEKYIVVGFETADQHPTGRGAYLVYRAYIYSIKDIVFVDQNLAKLASSMMDNKHQHDLSKSMKLGIYHSSSRSAQEHLEIEHNTLIFAAEYYRKGAMLLFRTLVFFPYQLEVSSGQKYLLVTVPSIAGKFNMSNSSQMHSKNVSSLKYWYLQDTILATIISVVLKHLKKHERK